MSSRPSTLTEYPEFETAIEAVLAEHYCTDIDQLSDEQFRPLADMLANYRKQRAPISQQQRSANGLELLKETERALLEFGDAISCAITEEEVERLSLELAEAEEMSRQATLISAAVGRAEQLWQAALDECAKQN